MNSRSLALSVAVALVVTGTVAWLGTKTYRQHELNVLNWDYYIGTTTLQTFTAKSNVSVNYKIYSSNEEARDFILQAPKSYDVVIPSDYMIDIMAAENRLGNIDLRKIPNISNVDPLIVSEFRQRGWLTHCVPYTWGTTGFAIRQKADDKNIANISPDLISWEYLRQNALGNQSLKGRVAIIDDPVQVLGSALIEIGADPKNYTKAEMNRAISLLQGVRPLIREFTKDTGKDLMKNGEAIVIFGASGDALQVAEKFPDWSYSSPGKGGFKFQDGICLVAGAPNSDSAHFFLNHLLDAEVHRNIVETDRYLTTNIAAMKLLDPRFYDQLREVARRGGPLQYVPSFTPQAREEFERAWILVKK